MLKKKKSFCLTKIEEKQNGSTVKLFISLNKYVEISGDCSLY